MKYIAILLLAIGAMLQSYAYDFSDESLDYKVMYKWGLINKQAGTVNITLRNENGKYDAVLTAKSAKWADHFYKLRDTLRAEITKKGFRPQRYEKIAHEGGEYKHDVVQYKYQGNTVIGHCTRYEEKDGKVKKDEQQVLEAEGKTVDMLSAFYYMRSLPFDTWRVGDEQTVNIYSGKRKELLQLRYEGLENVECDNKKYLCYKVTFIFTSDGKKKTSDDMTAWIAKDGRIPVKLEGKLPVGSVRCFLVDD